MIPFFDFAEQVDPLVLFTAILGTVEENASPGITMAHRVMLQDLADALRRGPLGSGAN